MNRFNRTPHLADWQDPDNRRIAIEQLRAKDQQWDDISRKWWEWVMVLKAAEHYGLRTPEKTALGIGSGRENPLFVFANGLRMTVATDIYGRGAWGSDGDVADGGMMRDPSPFWPSDLDRSGLIVADANACDLPFGDGSFDLVFSCSSVEHFGLSKNIAQSVREAYRVLRPGGIYALAVDYEFGPPMRKRRGKRRDPFREFLREEDIKELILGSAGFELDEEVDYHVDASDIVNPLDLETGRTETGNDQPSAWLKWRDQFVTSLFLVLLKR